jgi:hypothetical protein
MKFQNNSEIKKTLRKANKIYKSKYKSAEIPYGLASCARMNSEYKELLSFANLKEMNNSQIIAQICDKDQQFDYLQDFVMEEYEDGSTPYANIIFEIKYQMRNPLIVAMKYNITMNKIERIMKKFECNLKLRSKANRKYLNKHKKIK